MSALYPQFCERSEEGAFSLRIPESFNFAYDVVDCMAKEHPEQRALVWVQDESCALYAHTTCHERVLTFADMSRLSTQAANLLADKGIRKGDRVMLLLKRHYVYWYLLVALHKLGAVAMPTACMLNHVDLVSHMRDAEVSAVVCLGEESLCQKVASAAKDSPSVHLLCSVGKDFPGFLRLDDAVSAYPAEMERVETRKEDPLLLYFTSGTTGKPKIVVQDGMYPLAHIQTALLWQNVRDGGLHLSVADTGWAKASWGKIYGQWLCGSAVMAYDFDMFSATRMLHVLKEQHVTTFCAPPTIYRFFVKNHLLDDGFADVEYAVTAGEAIPAEIVAQFEKLTGLTIHSGYGQTESVLLTGDFVGDPVRPGAMGKASPLFHPIVVDEDGNECPPGEPGEIVLPSAGRCNAGLCMRSALGLELGDSVWHGDLYRTGDIAYRDAEGNFWFIGRVDDMIKCSGYRVSPFEVESVLIQHPAVMECAVTGLPDEQRGFVVKATVVLREGYTAGHAMTKELRDFVKEQTADYKVPRVIDYVGQLPSTFSGKIRRVEIRQRDARKAKL